MILADEINEEFEKLGNSKHDTGTNKDIGESHKIDLEGHHIGDVTVSWYDKQSKNDYDDDNINHVPILIRNSSSKMDQPINYIVNFCIKQIQLLLLQFI